MILALFTITKICKQPKHPSADEWIKMWCISISICCITSVVSDSVQPHRWQPTRLPRPWDSPGKNIGVGCHFLLQCVKVKSLSRVQLLATPWTAASQAPPSMGFSRQEYRSGVPLPSPSISIVLYVYNGVLLSLH